MIQARETREVRRSRWLEVLWPTAPLSFGQVLGKNALPPLPPCLAASQDRAHDEFGRPELLRAHLVAGLLRHLQHARLRQGGV